VAERVAKLAPPIQWLEHDPKTLQTLEQIMRLQTGRTPATAINARWQILKPASSRVTFKGGARKCGFSNRGLRAIKKLNRARRLRSRLF
jgi:hypothetical protein